MLERVLPSNGVACTALRQLHVRGLRTSDVVSVRALARTLPQCGQLQQLFLHHGQLDGAAIDILAPALSRCNALASLDLSSNAMDDDAVGRLAPRLPGCVELRTLALRENIFREQGVRQLAAALPRCRSLSQLMLFGLQANEAPLVRAKGPRLHLCFNDQPTPPLFTCAAPPPPRRPIAQDPNQRICPRAAIRAPWLGRTRRRTAATVARGCKGPTLRSADRLGVVGFGGVPSAANVLEALQVFVAGNVGPNDAHAAQQRRPAPRADWPRAGAGSTCCWYWYSCGAAGVYRAGGTRSAPTGPPCK